MSQQSDIQHLSVEEILEKLRSEAQKMPVSPTSFRYLRALESVESSVFSLQSSDCGEAAQDVSVGTHGPCVRESSMECVANTLKTQDVRLKTAITDWLVNQWLLGHPFSTASLYLDIISALYGAAVKAGELPSTDLFSDLKFRLRQLGQKGWGSGINEEIFARALRLTKNAHRLLLDDSIAADLMLLSLTHSLQPIQQLALLKREPGSHAETAKEEGPQKINTVLWASLHEMQEEPLVQQIIDRHCHNARKKYIFSLNQSQRTPLQIKKQVFKMANALFRRARLPQATDPNHTVESLWAYAALTAGVPASTVVAHLGHAPLGLPVLKLVRNCIASEDLRLKTEDLAPVGRVFLDNPARWYAMSLRPGVRFTQVCRRIQMLSKPFSSQDLRPKTQDFLSDIELFYPCEEIARAIGKKIVIKQRPFIHSVVFFKAKLTDIGPLFARIGDLAWCYRQSARPGAPYADITERQFRLFQQTIARFTPDYEVAPTGELELKKDDRVQIVGGLFAGHTASFDSVAHVAEYATPTFYRYNIIGENGI
ncbi:MAG: hypothetical protein K2L00_02410, partial [Muribaculaceae bacterium]|nr:hypothetical protein [Muribaculaceae bacterium]